MTREPLFKVYAMRPEDAKKAELLQAMVNRGDFVSKIVHATELFTQRFILPEILYGKSFTEREKDEGMKAIVAEIEKTETDGRDRP